MAICMDIYKKKNSLINDYGQKQAEQAYIVKIGYPIKHFLTT